MQLPATQNNGHPTRLPDLEPRVPLHDCATHRLTQSDQPKKDVEGSTHADREDLSLENNPAA